MIRIKVNSVITLSTRIEKSNSSQLPGERLREGEMMMMRKKREEKKMKQTTRSKFFFLSSIFKGKQQLTLIDTLTSKSPK